jgi:zinc transporter ZupT
MPVTELAEILLQTALSLFPGVDPCPTSSNFTGAMPPSITASQSRPRRKFSRCKRLLAFIIAILFILFTAKFLFIQDSTKPPAASKEHLGSLSPSTPFTLPSDGFSGCLLVKDDNDRLSEWIAYHWLTLPLKYLIVAVDPTGNTSPKQLLSLFNDTQYNLGMEIKLWNDADYGHWIDDRMNGVHKHRDRQKRFLAECQKHHKAKNRSWVAVIDTDEYLTFNILSDDDRDPERRNDVDVFDLIDGTNFTELNYRVEMQEARRAMTEDNVLTQKTVFEYISEHQEERPWISEPCYLMTRTLFSAIESPSHTAEDAGVDKYGLDVNKFNTLKYFKHGEKGSWIHNKYGKVIIDLSRTDANIIVHDMANIHVPLESCNYPFRLYETGLLRVHHYLGSWEQYSARSDVRRHRDKFDKSALVNFGTDYQLQGWLKRFVMIVGEQNSKELLQYSGVIDRGNSNKSLMDQPDYNYIKVNPPDGIVSENVADDEYAAEVLQEKELEIAKVKESGEEIQNSVELLYYFEGDELQKVTFKESGEEIPLDDPRIQSKEK